MQCSMQYPDTARLTAQTGEQATLAYVHITYTYIYAGCVVSEFTVRVDQLWRSL